MHRPMRLIILAAALGFVLLAHPFAARAEGSELRQTTLVLQWQPQAQFAGYFMAKDKGFYSEAGIDLTIIPGGPDVMASDYLEFGKADFVTMFLSAALQRRETLDMVNIGQFVQNSALMLIAQKASGIKTVDDLDGKKVGLWANEFQVQARALFKERGIDVTVVPQTNSLDLFMRGGVAAASGMWYNEFHTLYTYGFDEEELVPFFFSDFDLNFPEDGIYTLAKTAAGEPELCSALVQATIRGWQYAFEHPEEALDSVIRRMKKAGVPANRAHQRWMLNRMRDIVRIDDIRAVGILRRGDYERVSKTLLEHGFIKGAPPYEAFYRGEMR